MLTATIMTAHDAAKPAAREPRQGRRPPPVHAATRATPTFGDALVRAESEYREMPGLSLTLPQAARLWGMDRRTCELVLTNLIERRILKRALDGTYVRR